MRTLLILVTALVLVLPGCKKKEEGTDTPATETDPAAADKPADPAAGKPDEAAAEAKMRNKMKHCPNAIDGANTSFEKTEAALVITIAHADAAKLAEVKERAEHLASVAGKPEPDIKHSGQGTGGGASGNCPVGIKNTKVTVADAEGKVVVTLEPMDDTTVDALYAEATTRQAKLREGGGKEHGSGTGGGTGGGGGKGEGDKVGGAGKAAQKEGHEHATGAGAGDGPGEKGGASGNKDGKPGN